ncbi:MAG: heme exporter protein CcmD [Pseudomonadota bacterium]
MNWASWNDFLAMGGYGLYVWGSVLVVLGMMAAELVLLGLSWQAIHQHLGRWHWAAEDNGDEVQA